MNKDEKILYIGISLALSPVIFAIAQLAYSVLIRLPLIDTLVILTLGILSGIGFSMLIHATFKAKNEKDRIEQQVSEK